MIPLSRVVSSPRFDQANEGEAVCRIRVSSFISISEMFARGWETINSTRLERFAERYCARNESFMFVLAELAYFSTTVTGLRYPYSKMATFTMQFQKCNHQDGFNVISTVKGRQTGRDLLNEFHPDVRKTNT